MSEINYNLAARQKLTPKDIVQIKELWRVRDDIESVMSQLNEHTDKEYLLALYGAWTENEFQLQELWKFNKNKNYHRDYCLPHCKCPVMDNDDYLGMDFRISQMDCIYHGVRDE